MYILVGFNIDTPHTTSPCTTIHASGRPYARKSIKPNLREMLFHRIAMFPENKRAMFKCTAQRHMNTGYVHSTAKEQYRYIL